MGQGEEKGKLTIFADGWHKNFNGMADDLFMFSDWWWIIVNATGNSTTGNVGHSTLIKHFLQKYMLLLLHCTQVFLSLFFKKSV